MSDELLSDGQLSRRKFLAGAGAVLGLAAIPAFAKPSVAEAAVPPKQLPWAYTTQDAEKLGRRAYESYYLFGGCAEATWWPLVEALALDTTNPDMDSWASLPRKMFAFGGGGVNGWGTICGTLNGSSAIIKMIGADGSLIDNNMQFYGETPLPTNGIDKAVRGGWAPVTGTTPPVPAPLVNAPTCTAHTQLCHASISQWTTMTGLRDGGPEQKDRCAKACYDLMKHTVENLNAWSAIPSVKPSAVLDPTVAGCSNTATANTCHAAAGPKPMKSKMACDPCHDETVTHSTK